MATSATKSTRLSGWPTRINGPTQQTDSLSLMSHQVMPSHSSMSHDLSQRSVCLSVSFLHISSLFLLCRASLAHGHGLTHKHIHYLDVMSRKAWPSCGPSLSDMRMAVCVCVCVYLCVCLCVYECVCVCSMCVCVSVCIYVCVLTSALDRESVG